MEQTRKLRFFSDLAPGLTQANFMFKLIVKTGDRLGQYLQSRNASDSADHVVKVADHLGCLGWDVHTGRKNPRRREIV